MRIKAAAASSAGFTLAAWIAATVAALCTLLLIALFIPAAYGGEAESGAAAQPSESGEAEQPSASGIAHPTKAVCRVCDVRGGEHGLEDVVTWRQYEGRAYYFCSNECAQAFDADPAAYAFVTGPRLAPDILLTFLDGTESSLNSMAGDVVLVDFWATWCKPCLKSMPEIQKLHDELSGSGFRAVGIAIDEGDDKKVRETVKKKKFTYPIAIDRQVAPAWEAFHVPAVPAMYLVGRDGVIAKQWIGKVDIDEVRKAVREAVAVKAAG